MSKATTFNSVEADLILNSLNSLYKGKIVRINFNRFCKIIPNLYFKQYPFEDFEGEVNYFFKDKDNNFYVEIGFNSKLYYTDKANIGDYANIKYLATPMKSYTFKLISEGGTIKSEDFLISELI